jgi:hypothetical protein
LIFNKVRMHRRPLRIKGPTILTAEGIRIAYSFYEVLAVVIRRMTRCGSSRVQLKEKWFVLEHVLGKRTGEGERGV